MSTAMEWTPSRKAGLTRLDDFAPRAGGRYASSRNYDFGPDKRTNVSALSPWLRRRMVSEQEVLDVVLARHPLEKSEKFVQEVYWRAYFKGWLERRPEIWRRYRRDLKEAAEALDANAGLRTAYAEAVEGRTGIDGFDDWAQELVATGWLHNHARMWFASIWIFTLRLPWVLGADFSLQHLLDADAASNTLSWRWVGGLHTRGKTYLARADNIERYTKGRFRPTGLSPIADPLEEAENPPAAPAPGGDALPDGEYLLVMTDDDLTPEVPRRGDALIMTADDCRALGAPGAVSAGFQAGAVSDASDRLGGVDHVEATDWTETLVARAKAAGVTDIVAPYAPVGWSADRLAAAEPVLQEAGVTIHMVLRDYDRAAWPYTHKGFFALKKQIPKLIGQPLLI